MSSPSDTPPPPTAGWPSPPTGGSPAPPPDARPRLLRRSDTNRVAAGVCGGLGEYFGVDPVLFRVLFATTAFFGGAGILAYLIAWAAIPERGAAHAPIDRLVGGGRPRTLPVWILTLAGAAIVWGVLFSWWAPWRLFPGMFVLLLLAAVVLVVALSRRPAATPEQPVPSPGAAAETPVAPSAWDDTPGWLVQARAKARERRRRAAPVRWSTLGLLAATLGVLGIVDAASGIAIPVYFWAAIGVVLAGLLVGAALRRPVWWLALLLAPAAFGAFVFIGCRASLHDGSGDNTYTPVSAGALHSDYRQAFGRLRLDLTQLPALTAPRPVDITLAAGEVDLIIPRDSAVTVHANVHLGDIRVDGDDTASGMNLNRDALTAAPGSRAPLTINVHLNAGDLSVDHG